MESCRQCIVCFDKLESDEKLLKINMNAPDHMVNSSDVSGTLNMFLKAFELNIPKSIYIDLANSNLDFCAKCSVSVARIDAFVSQISALQQQVLEMKAMIKSNIRKSRQLFREKENNRFDANISLIRDLTTGVSVALVQTKQSLHIAKNITYVDTKLNPSLSKLQTRDVFSKTSDFLPDNSPDLFEICESEDFAAADDDFIYADQTDHDHDDTVSDSMIDPFHDPTQSSEGRENVKTASDCSEQDADINTKKEPKLKVTSSSDGRLYYQNVEILRVEHGFRCSICQYKKFFKHQLSTVLHIKKNHIEDKDGWFQCEACGKQYLHKSQLELHQKIHLDEKPHMCDVCGRLFKLLTTLKGHLKTHEDRQKSFSCEFCGKNFAHLRDCVVHTRTHTKERPFKCDFCPKSFIVRTLLNTHVLKAHPGLCQS